MDSELEQKIKDKLLESLIEAMEDKMGDRMMPPKAMQVEVAAPNKEKLAEGLDKAKEVVGGSELPGEDGSKEEESGESDEDRLRELLEGEGQDDETDSEDEKEKLLRR